MRSSQGEYQDDTNNLLRFDKLPGAIWSAASARERAEQQASFDRLRIDESFDTFVPHCSGRTDNMSEI